MRSYRTRHRVNRVRALAVEIIGVGIALVDAVLADRVGEAAAVAVGLHAASRRKARSFAISRLIAFRWLSIFLVHF